MIERIISRLEADEKRLLDEMTQSLVPSGEAFQLGRIAGMRSAYQTMRAAIDEIVRDRNVDPDDR